MFSQILKSYFKLNKYPIKNDTYLYYYKSIIASTIESIKYKINIPIIENKLNKLINKDDFLLEIQNKFYYQNIPLTIYIIKLGLMELKKDKVITSIDEEILLNKIKYDLNL